MICLEKNSEQEYIAYIKPLEEYDNSYNIQIIERPPDGDIVINLVNKYTDEYIGTICRIIYEEENQDFDVEVWKKYDFEDEEDPDIRYKYKLPKCLKKVEKQYTLKVTTEEYYTAKIKASNYDEAYAIMKDMHFNGELEKVDYGIDSTRFDIYEED